MIYPEILSDGLSDHYLILLGFLISFFFFFKVGSKKHRWRTSTAQIPRGREHKDTSNATNERGKTMAFVNFFFSRNTSRKATGGSG